MRRIETVMRFLENIYQQDSSAQMTIENGSLVVHFCGNQKMTFMIDQVQANRKIFLLATEADGRFVSWGITAEDAMKQVMDTHSHIKRNYFTADIRELSQPFQYTGVTQAERDEYFQGCWTEPELNDFAIALRAQGNELDTSGGFMPGVLTQSEALIFTCCGDTRVQKIFSSERHLVVVSVDTTIEVFHVIDRQSKRIAYNNDDHIYNLD